MSELIAHISRYIWVKMDPRITFEWAGENIEIYKEGKTYLAENTSLPQ